MGIKKFFTKEDEHGRKSIRVGRVAGTACTAFLAAATAISSMYVNEARQVSLEVRFGKIVDTVTDSGLQFKTPFLSSKFQYPLSRQTTYIGAETTLRTSDDIRVTNPFTVEFEINENADIGNLYYELQGTGEDINDVIQKLSRDVAVRVFEELQVTDLAEPGITDTITSRIQERLQTDLSDKGWPVNVIDVLSDGFQLSPESEDELSKIISIRQESARLDLRQINAEKAENVLRTEAKAYVAYADELRAAGLPDADLRCAIYDKMAQDTGRVMEPFAQVCGNASASFGSDIAVAVDPANVNMPRDIKPDVLAPAAN